jgi:hypothetical protein
MCPYCGVEVPEERLELGYYYCTAKNCVVKGLRERQENLRLILMPKQGFTYVFADSDDLNNGRSSGRS